MALGPDLWPWLALAGLGAFHGINPAMGWLFAVALGMHRGSRAVVGWALIPIVLGHAIAIAFALAALVMLGSFLDATMLNTLAGALLIAWGFYHLLRGHRHRLRFGLTTGLAGLALWSFVMASAHGAGFMVAPFVLEGAAAHTHHSHHGDHASTTGSLSLALAAMGTHTLAMAATTVLVAIIVYDWLGLAVLRRAWINLDWVWAGALIGAGTLIVSL